MHTSRTYPKTDTISEVLLPLGKREVPAVFVYPSPATITVDGEIRAYLSQQRGRLPRRGPEECDTFIKRLRSARSSPCPESCPTSTSTRPGRCGKGTRTRCRQRVSPSVTTQLFTFACPPVRIDESFNGFPAAQNGRTVHNGLGYYSAVLKYCN